MIIQNRKSFFCLPEIVSSTIRRHARSYCPATFYYILHRIAIVLVSSSACSPNQESWKAHYRDITVYSSPRVADLNKDGIGDIIVGTGAAEWAKTDTGFVALDGRNGKMLWHVPARNQIVGSAVLYDITNDGIEDVFLGGRSAELKAIDGASGRVLWEFFGTDEPYGHRKAGWYNFTTPQLIDDQNGDGYRDLLVANGGEAFAKPHDPNRPAGWLLIISSKDKKIIAQAKMPDGKEIYMSPVISDMGRNTDNSSIFFGTGGETIAGSFYRTTLKDLLKNDISRAVKLAASTIEKGFVASPVLADITQDGVYDIIQNAVEGRMMAFDGKTKQLLWDNRFLNTECYVSPAPGYFNDDDIPDFFMAHSVGVWPHFDKVMDVAFLDGKTGKIIGKHEYLNCSFTFAAPLTADVNGDGFTEVILAINQRSTPVEPKPGDQFQSKFLFYDFHHQDKRYLKDSLQGINWASTPYLGDIDRDGKTDMVGFAEATTRDNNPEEASYRHPKGVNVFKKTIVDFTPDAIYWSGYLGTDSNSVFTKKRIQKTNRHSNQIVNR